MSKNVPPSGHWDGVAGQGGDSFWLAYASNCFVVVDVTGVQGQGASVVDATSLPNYRKTLR